LIGCTRSAPFVGLLSLVFTMLSLGSGSAATTTVQAQSLKSIRAFGEPVFVGSSAHQAIRAGALRISPGLADSPSRFAFLHPLFLAGDMYVLPAVPSSMNLASSSAAHGQAGPVWIVVSGSYGAHVVQVINAQGDSPPQVYVIQEDSLALLTRLAAQSAWFAGSQGATKTLAASFSVLSNRSSQGSALALERVLDGQSFTTSQPVAIARMLSDLPTDLALTAQRLPMASGLRLIGMQPQDTWFQQPPTATPLPPTATPPPPPTPVPPTAVPPTSVPPTAVPSTPFFVAPTSTPQPDPTSSYTSVNLIAAATPTAALSGPSTWTGSNMPGSNAALFLITGYVATGNRTATGTIPHWGTVAVDPRVIPLNATVYIQGLGVFHAEDTGGAVIGNHVDVFVGSNAEAYQITSHRLVSWTR